ncbi:MAG: amidohydrolase [Bacteroidales bacterium]|nr:amidohydrolase [Bacteroidales bacterium]
MKKQEADLVITNGKIYTADPEFTIVESLAIKKGKIIALGTSEEILKTFSAAQTIDLQGQTAYPGFIDAHCHFLGYGLNLQQADLTGTLSFDDVLKKLEDFYKKNPAPWIIGRGWDQNDWETRKFPHKSKLDAVFPDVPVFITRIDGHAALANTKAIKMAGITENSFINGGTFEKDGLGLTGILIDNAQVFIRNIIPKETPALKTRALLEAQENCFAVGLTSIADAGMDKEDILLINSLHENKLLQMKIYAMLNPTLENFEFFVKKGIYITPKLSIRSIKLFADGALGSRGALLLKPYSDDPKNSGLLLHDKVYFSKIFQLAFDNNYQVNTHCIGDSANRLLLNWYGEFLKTKNDRRWRIEHAQVVSERDLELFGRYSVIPSVQPTHATSDMYWAEQRLGERVKEAYAYKRLLDQNGWIANGSDFPVESINPILGFYAAVVRKDQKGYPPGGFQSRDALSRGEALKAMTLWAAKAAFEEKIKGSLEPGKSADIVITDQDLMTIYEEKIPIVQVVTTISDGKIVYSKK